MARRIPVLTIASPVDPAALGLDPAIYRVSLSAWRADYTDLSRADEKAIGAALDAGVARLVSETPIEAPAKPASKGGKAKASR